MRDVKCLVPLLILAVALCCCPNVDAQYGSEKQETPQLALDATSSKTVYEQGQPVEIDFTLRNIGRRELVVARWLRLTTNIALDISGDGGKSAQWCGRIAETIDSERSYTILEPGKSVHAKLTVSCINGEIKNRAWGFAFDGPGQYIIKAKYRLPRPREHYKQLFPNFDIIRGPILAKPLKIELK